MPADSVQVTATADFRDTWHATTGSVLPTSTAASLAADGWDADTVASVGRMLTDAVDERTGLVIDLLERQTPAEAIVASYGVTLLHFGSLFASGSGRTVAEMLPWLSVIAGDPRPDLQKRARALAYSHGRPVQAPQIAAWNNLTPLQGALAWAAGYTPEQAEVGYAEGALSESMLRLMLGLSGWQDVAASYSSPVTAAA